MCSLARSLALRLPTLALRLPIWDDWKVVNASGDMWPEVSQAELKRYRKYLAQKKRALRSTDEQALEAAGLREVFTMLQKVISWHVALLDAQAGLHGSNPVQADSVFQPFRATLREVYADLEEKTEVSAGCLAHPEQFEKKKNSLRQRGDYSLVVPLE